MEAFFSFSCFFLMPVYGFLFCFYFIKLIKKLIKGQNDTNVEASVMTIMFILIIWSISYTVAIGN
ncbi:hypothetical protein SAMN02787079_01786 [Lysinibacillus sp. TC-37]|nr:hypothetical protein AK833_17000 [Lysinibacillus sp. F5]SCY54884.1 hypothetical protein SAMN02787078_01785 [Lysinibacillus sp. SG9]SDB23593.1 hypothetical protein SAMN02787079_01786 [Lysinibacillus sp. TC-37]SFS69971.1 hypothetical protein SAMN02787087_01562 [Lysinibacillus sp. SG55]